MADDIVTRLREHWEDEKMLGNDLLAEALGFAADEIERLRADRDKWKGWAQEYVFPDCECQMCNEINAAVNGDR